MVLTATPSTGDPFSVVRLSARVRSALAGIVMFYDGDVALASSPVTDHAAAVTTDQLDLGRHHLFATFVSQDRTLVCTSAVVDVLYGAEPDEQAVSVSIPAGALTVTTPYTPEHPLDLGTAVLDPATSTFAACAELDPVLVTDTRAGDLGFVVDIVSLGFTGPGGARFGGEHVGLTQVQAVQVVGNALPADRVVTGDVPAGDPGLAMAQPFAAYPASAGVGSTRLRARLDVAGVPTSLPSGRYRGTIVLTAM